MNFPGSTAETSEEEEIKTKKIMNKNGILRTNMWTLLENDDDEQKRWIN